MNAQITRSSGDQTFDGEVLLMLQRASPVPAPPIEVKGEIVNLSTPFTFKP
ncbi:energy transducer TonB [Microvirga sp. 2MCAF38]|uniref:energy transducer TonB family protein n=1 Tax=Microvirga sp. 2MCAF38 TaxID=3232989 RepID=UPI003F98CE2F